MLGAGRLHVGHAEVRGRIALHTLERCALACAWQGWLPPSLLSAKQAN